jgi:hypothetical protein
MQARIILVAICITACQSAPVITKPQVVKIEVEKLIPIPAQYLAACPGKPAKRSSANTNGDLEWIVIGYEEGFVPCIESRLEAIRALNESDRKP